MVDRILLDNFKATINSSQNVVIIPHLSPDGDAMGSSLGLFHALRIMKKQVQIILPSAYPSFLGWMPEIVNTIDFEKEEEKAIGFIKQADVLVFLDFNSLKRLAGMKQLIADSEARKIMIDHHPYPEQIADVTISVPQASSTCELVYNVLVNVNWDAYVDKDAAECFYTGIMTDTGSLSYNSANPETYRVVAQLLEKKVDKDKIHQLVFHSNSFHRMKLLGHVLGEKMILMPEQGAAFLWLDEKELEKHHFQPGDTEGFVNYPLSIEGINISAFFIEKDNKVKCSFRSRGDFPVNQFSEINFDGGGHRNAAGGLSLLTLEETLTKFKLELPKFYQNYIQNAK